MPNYPTSLDSLTNPGSGTYTDDSGFELDVVIGRLQDIAEALEAKLGIGSSAAAANQVLRGTGTGVTSFGAIDQNYLSNRTRYINLGAGQFSEAEGSPSTGSQSYWVYWALDGSTTREAVATTFIVPEGWVSGTLSVTVYVMPSTASSSKAWSLQINYQNAADGTVLSNSAASVESHNVPGTQYELDVFTATAILPAPSAAGTLYRLTIRRLYDDAGDTYPDDLWFVGARVDFTADM